MMTNRSWIMIAALGLSMVAPGSAEAAPVPKFSPLGQPRTVLTETDAYTLLPPELVAAPAVTNFSLSGSGRYVLAERENMRISQESLRAAQARQEPPPGEISLMLWDSREGTSREIWKAPLGTTWVQKIAWVPRSDVAFVLIQQGQEGKSRQVLLRIAAATQKAQVIGLTDLGDNGRLDLHVSPTQPLSVLELIVTVPQPTQQPLGPPSGAFAVQRTVCLLSPSGQLGPKLTLPAESRSGSLEWDESGNPVLLLFQSLPQTKAPIPKRYALDPRTAALRALEKMPALYAGKSAEITEPPAGAPLRVKLSTSSAREGETSANLGVLWLESVRKSERPRALICGDSTGGQLLPNGEAVLYFSQGALWAAPLLRMSKEEDLLSIARARQAVVMSNAKQVGLGLLLYAQDYDDVLPGGEDIQNKLTPYLKDASFLDGFVYTFLGGKISDISNPVETELGYISSAGGRVVVYADGHVALKKE